MKNKVLSISIAGYNIEKYVKHTLDSFIIPEIIEDLEVILVNDGSKDNTAILAQAYADQYPDLFRIINKENGGYGSTINTSSQQAMGKYYKTIDGDDWVDKVGMIALIHYLKKCDDDIVITNYSRVSDKNGKIVPTIFESQSYESSMLFEQAYKGQELYMQAIAIKTDILKKCSLNITHHCFYTDIEYILTPMPYVRTISFLNQNVYMYRIALNEQSMSVAGKKKHIDEQFKVFNKMLYYYNDQYKKLNDQKKEYFDIILSSMLKSHIMAILSLKTNRISYLRLLEFEKNTKGINKRIFYAANRFKPIYLLRWSHYTLYGAGSLCYKIYQHFLSWAGR